MKLYISAGGGGKNVMVLKEMKSNEESMSDAGQACIELLQDMGLLL